MKCRVAGLLALALVLLVTTVLCAQDFSADLVNVPSSSRTAADQDAGVKTPATSAPTKFYVSKDKVRFGQGGGPDQLALTVIVDLTNQTTTSLFSWQSSYRIIKGVPNSLHFFRTTDPENACADWQKIAGKSLACQKAGSETLDGRNMIKYRSVDAARPTDYIWVDPKLNFVVRWENEKGAAELRNIKEGPQPESLFTVPKDYSELKALPQKKREAKTPVKTR